MTDQDIDKAWRSQNYTADYDTFRMAVGRAIEAAATAPLLERIAELEAKLAYRVTDTPIKLSECQFLETLSAAAPAAPEQQEPNQKAKNMDDPNMHAYGDHYAEITEAILRDVCELEPANPNLNDTLCVDVSDLKIIVDRALMNAQAPNAQQAEPPAWNALVSDREYLRLFDEARHGSTGGFGVLRGIRACIAAYEAATPAQQAEAQEPCAACITSVVGAGPNDVGIQWRGGFARKGELLYRRPQPAQLQLSDDMKRAIVEGWFAEDWAINNAIKMLDDYESALAANNGVNLK